MLHALDETLAFLAILAQARIWLEFVGDLLRDISTVALNMTGADDTSPISGATNLKLYNLMHSKIAVDFDTSASDSHPLTVYFLDIVKLLRTKSGEQSELVMLANQIQHNYWEEQLNMLKESECVRVLDEFYRESKGLSVVRELFAQKLDSGRSAILNDMTRWMVHGFRPLRRALICQEMFVFVRHRITDAAEGGGATLMVLAELLNCEQKRFLACCHTDSWFMLIYSMADLFDGIKESSDLTYGSVCWSSMDLLRDIACLNYSSDTRELLRAAIWPALEQLLLRPVSRSWQERVPVVGMSCGGRSNVEVKRRALDSLEAHTGRKNCDVDSEHLSFLEKLQECCCAFLFSGVLRRKDVSPYVLESLVGRMD